MASDDFDGVESFGNTETFVFAETMVRLLIREAVTETFPKLVDRPVGTNQY
jgi:hypothetical protein